GFAQRLAAGRPLAVAILFLAVENSSHPRRAEFMRTLRVLTTAFVLGFGSTLVCAHNGGEHIMGAVTALNEGSVTVETVAHSSTTILLDATTKFTRNDVRISRRDLKVGDRVAIDAKQTSSKQLLGLTVRVGAPGHATDHGSTAHTDR